MVSVNSFGGPGQNLDNPPLGGPNGWAAAVAAALDGSDVPVNTRIQTAEDAIRADVGLPVAGRNRLINGDFVVNQRHFYSTSTNGYHTADRWFLSAIGGTFSLEHYSESTNDLPETQRSCLRLTAGSQVGATNQVTLNQRIEYVYNLSGKHATLSFWAKGSTDGMKVGPMLVQHFGQGGNPAPPITTVMPVVTTTTTWTRYFVPVDVPSIHGKQIGSNGGRVSLILCISNGPSGGSHPGVGLQNGSVSFFGVQLEEGEATPFEEKSYGVTLRECQRYFQRVGGAASGYVAAATIGRFAIWYLEQMAITPTVTLDPGSPGVLNSTQGNPVVNSIGLQGVYSHAAYIDVNITGTMIGGQGCLWYGFVLEFNAEIP